MKKLPPIEVKKRPMTIQKLPPITSTEKNKEHDKQQTEKDKLSNLRNYDIAISYYTKNINNNKHDPTFLVKRAICYLAKGFFTLALKDALQSISIDKNFEKGYYIAALSYLEMYDIEMAEKFSKNKNKRLKALIEKSKKELAIKSNKFKSYLKYTNFLKELYKFDSFFPKLEIHFYTDDYRGVIAKSFIQKEEIIMTIPHRCLISLETALETNYGKEIGKIMYTELNSPKHCLLSAFMLYELKNPKYKYYFDLLPHDYSNFPIFYTEQELEYLKGSPFLAQIYEKKSDIKNDYAKLCYYLKDFNQFSYQSFMEARMMISSRIFGVTINDNKTDVLAPFADLLNHKRPKQTLWYYDDSLGCFVIQATEDIEEGAEIFDSYGKKSNARFLLNYGFSLEENDAEEYTLKIVFNESYPMYEIKKNFFEPDAEFSRNFILNNDFYESNIVELLSFLRFMLFEGDMQVLYDAMYSHESLSYEEFDLNFYYISPITKELEIKVLKHLHLLCRKALAKYPTTYEQDEAIYKAKKDSNFNLRNCLLLVMSEKNVLGYYIYFCEYCIELLTMNNEVEVISKLANDYKYNECEFDFYIQEVILKFMRMDTY